MTDVTRLAMKIVNEVRHRPLEKTMMDEVESLLREAMEQGYKVLDKDAFWKAAQKEAYTRAVEMAKTFCIFPKDCPERFPDVCRVCQVAVAIEKLGEGK